MTSLTSQKYEIISLCETINEQYYCYSKAGLVCCQRFMKINQLLMFELKRAQ